MARPKLTPWDIAEKLGVTTKKEEEDKKITDIQQVLSVYDDCPEDFKAIMPSMRCYKNHDDYFIVRIKLAERLVDKRKEELDDFKASKDPVEMTKRKAIKFQKTLDDLHKKLLEMGIDPSTLSAG